MTLPTKSAVGTRQVHSGTRDRSTWEVHCLGVVTTPMNRHEAASALRVTGTPAVNGIQSGFNKGYPNGGAREKRAG